MRQIYGAKKDAPESAFLGMHWYNKE